MITPTTVGGVSVNLVTLPSSPAPRSVEYTGSDTVGVVTSIFTGQMQTQVWPGADMWSWTVTMSPLTAAQADVWVSFLLECRGMANPFQIGDPMHQVPAGAVHGQPVVDGAVPNTMGTSTLYTRGWRESSIGLLLPGDHIQVGYNLHRVLDRADSDVNGKLPLNIWPSLRYSPQDGETVVVNKPRGLFRLAKNQRAWSADYTRLTRLSFPIVEYR